MYAFVRTVCALRVWLAANPLSFNYICFRHSTIYILYGMLYIPHATQLWRAVSKLLKIQSFDDFGSLNRTGDRHRPLAEDLIGKRTRLELELGRGPKASQGPSSYIGNRVGRSAGRSLLAFASNCHALGARSESESFINIYSHFNA